jgi:hypothetical protein
MAGCACHAVLHCRSCQRHQQQPMASSQACPPTNLQSKSIQEHCSSCWSPQEASKRICNASSSSSSSSLLSRLAGC